MKNILMKKKINITLIVIFLMCLLIPILFINREKGRISEEENRYLADFPDPFSREGFENWFNDNIGFRGTFVSLHANIMYHLFRLSPSQKIVIGKQGWLFYTGDNNLKIADGTYPLTQEELDEITTGQREVRDFLKDRNCDYYLILPPSKVSVYYEYLKGNYDVKDTPADVAEREIYRKTGVNVINLKERLLGAKKTETVFLKTDTHWNQVGAYEAYEEIHDRLFPDLGKPEVEIYDTLVKGEFSNMMGASGLLPDEETRGVRIVAPNAKLTKKTDGREFIYHNEMGNGQTCLMFGDSLFGADWNIKELLAEDFTDFIFIWTYDFDAEKIEKYSPDIVLYDMGERFINTLGKHCRL